MIVCLLETCAYQADLSRLTTKSIPMLFNLINLNMHKSLLEHIDNKTNKLTTLGDKNQNYEGKNCGIISYDQFTVMR